VVKGVDVGLELWLYLGKLAAVGLILAAVSCKGPVARVIDRWFRLMMQRMGVRV